MNNKSRRHPKLTSLFRRNRGSGNSGQDIVSPDQKSQTGDRKNARQGLKSRLIALLLLSLLLPGTQSLMAYSPPSLQGEPLSDQALLQLFARMDSTRKVLSYTGVFAILRDGRMHGKYPLQIWVKPPDIYHVEPLAPLEVRKRFREIRHDMEKRPFGRLLNFHHPDGAEFYGPMPQKKYIELFKRNYRVWEEPDGQIADRKTHLLEIVPVFRPRFGIRLWYDDETYFILQRQIVFYENDKPPLTTLEITFREIQFYPEIPDSIVKIAEHRIRQIQEHKAKWAGKKRQRMVFSSLDSLKKSVGFDIFAPAQLPEGFELMSITLSKEKKREIVHLHYTDGLLNLSIFEFRGATPKPIKKLVHMSRKKKIRPLQFRQIYAVKQGDYAFLLIGNLPAFELKKIADSLQVY